MKCAGEKFWRWRAVDQHGTVLEEILQKRREKRAAKRVLVALMKRYGFAPKRIITDKLRSYRAAKAEVAPGLDHWSHKGLNNRAENSHLAVRRRERRMMRFKSARQWQSFVSAHGQIANLFLLHRKHLTAADYRELRGDAVTTWCEISLSISA